MSLLPADVLVADLEFVQFSSLLKLFDKKSILDNDDICTLQSNLNPNAYSSPLKVANFDLSWLALF